MANNLASTGILALALLAPCAPALAAELPARNAAAVEPNRACTSHGAGFFSVPGSETCLRVSGRVRSDYRVVQPRTRSEGSSGFRTGARVQLDARTPTPYGTLRTVVRYDTRGMRN
ncbi:MAG: hypothetical protein K0S56_3282 [Microvirga sp.]|jgi:hypothetical protein|nr:hypothetical protein [Microvirga sp.]